MRPLLILLFVAAATPIPVQAMSTSYQGSIGLMGWNQPTMTQWVANHSVTSWFAPAVEYTAFRKPGEETRELLVPQLGFLVHRINATASQANLYVNAGYGFDRRAGRRNHGVLNSEAQLDWESRRLYSALDYQAVRLGAPGENPIDVARLRLGIAPFLGEFEQLNSFLILQLERSTAISRETEITPLVRLFYLNVLIEIGMSLRGETHFNFMIHM